jgi:eukaryotic-like serine/threonine-protein kinase
MPLTSGTKIGPYEIASLLGVGGMGEVYRSRDSKLGREVAIKVLPSAVGAEPDRLARFRREAKLLASLNHANIAAIYGLEDSGTAHALVMELVEGPTLADRVKSGPSPPTKLSPLPNKSAKHSNTRMIGASSIATSSPPTSSALRKAP